MRIRGTPPETPGREGESLPALSLFWVGETKASRGSDTRHGRAGLDSPTTVNQPPAVLPLDRARPPPILSQMGAPFVFSEEGAGPAGDGVLPAQ